MDPRIAARFGDAARAAPPGAALVVEGPLAWLAASAGGFPRAAHVLVAGTWTALEGLAAFSALVREARPPLAPWEPIVAAHKALTADEPLLTREQLTDLADPRWQTFPIEARVVGAWHPPHVVTSETAGARDGRPTLVWFVERFPHRAGVARVAVDDTGEVRVAPL